jgi:hypothetical protein
MDFEAQFSQWIKESLAAEVPKRVKGFAFLLGEPAETKGSKFAVDPVGTDRFDADGWPAPVSAWAWLLAMTCRTKSTFSASRSSSGPAAAEPGRPV